MRKIKIIFTLFLLAYSSFLWSQEDLITPRLTTNSQYEYVKFTPGILYLNNDSTIETLLNYNVLTEEIHFLNKKVIQKINSNKIKYVSLNNSLYHSINSKIYKEIYKNDKYRLLYIKKPNLSDLNTVEGGYNITTETSSVKKLNNYTVNNASGSDFVVLKDDKGKKVKTSDQFYILNKKGRLIFATKNKIIKFSKKDKNEIKSFIKNNNLTTNNKDDLIKILDFM